MWPICFPHASANVETRGESVFAARNAIDGMVCNRSHGSWPYGSWGINRRQDAEFLLDFGRPVDIDCLVLWTRADFPHDNWWVQAGLIFSDGSEAVIRMEKSRKPHEFSIEKKRITWLKLVNLIQAEDPSPFPTLTQIEVYGTEHGQALKIWENTGLYFCWFCAILILNSISNDSPPGEKSDSVEVRIVRP